MDFLTSDGVKLNYELTGKGKPLVFVTGFGGYQEVWSAQVEYFAQMGYQVLTYDHRNFGRSQRTEKGHSLQQLTDDLIELLSFLKIKQAAFVGHSMGGSLLYDLIQTKPEVVALAVIVDQTPFMLNTSDWPYGFMNYTADNYAVAAAKPPAVHETLHGLAPEVALELNNARVAHPFNRSDNFDLLKEHIVHDWRPVVKNCPVPLGVIAAKQSPYYDTEFTEWMKQVNPAVLTSVVDNCGHDVVAEVPDQFNQILRHFLLKNRYLYN